MPIHFGQVGLWGGGEREGGRGGSGPHKKGHCSHHNPPTFVEVPLAQWMAVHGNTPYCE
jgi:hypothetical protein